MTGALFVYKEIVADQIWLTQTRSGASRIVRGRIARARWHVME